MKANIVGLILIGVGVLLMASALMPGNPISNLAERMVEQYAISVAKLP